MLLLLLLLLLLLGMSRVESEPEIHQGYNLTVQKEVVVQEGLCVLVPCKFSYPKEEVTHSDPIRGYWYKEEANIRKPGLLVATSIPQTPAQRKAEGRFFLSGDLWKDDCSLKISDITKKAEGNYFFRLERGEVKYNYLVNKMILLVTALTDTPHTLIPETIEAGRPSNLTCSVPWTCEWLAPLNFSWTGTSVSLLSTNTNGPSVLTITPQSQDHGTNLTCQVTLPGTGATSRTTIRLNVSYAPKNLTVTIYRGADQESTTLVNGSSLPVSEGQYLRLFCSANSYPPATLSWSWDTLNLCPSNLSKPGLLELTAVHLKHGGLYTCRAQHALGSQHISLTLSPQSNATVSEMMTGTLVGAGAATLLFLSFCIIFLVVRSCRKKPGRSAAGAPDLSALKASVSQSPLVEFQADDSSEPLPSTADVVYSSTEEEVHYATLNFHEAKPRNPQVKEDTATEYSEIKFHK